MKNEARRTFLLISSRAFAAAAGLVHIPRMAGIAATPREYSAGRNAIELDGAFAGFVGGVTGPRFAGSVAGRTPSEVARGPAAVGTLSRGATVNRSSATAAVPDSCAISLACTAGMAPAFYGWLQGSVMHANPLKSGSILTLDQDFNVIRRLNWTSGRVTKVQFPPLDAHSANVGELLVDIEAIGCTEAKGDGKLRDAPRVVEHWRTNSFNLSGYPGLNYVSNVSAIELPTLTRGGSFALQIEPPRAREFLAQTAKTATPPPLQLAYLNAERTQSFFTLVFERPQFGAREAAGRLGPIEVRFADATMQIGPAAMRA